MSASPDLEPKAEVSTSSNEVKPGYKTTEFWFSVAAGICGMLYASGVLSEGSAVEKVVGIVATALVALGYTAARGKAKA